MAALGETEFSELSMRTLFGRAGWRWPAAMLAGSVIFLAGCDPTLQANLESSAITAINSLFAAILQAIVGLAQQATSSTSGSSGATTQAIIDVAHQVFA